jgi:hypothetical protein
VLQEAGNVAARPIVGRQPAVTDQEGNSDPAALFGSVEPLASPFMAARFAACSARYGCRTRDDSSSAKTTFSQ